MNALGPALQGALATTAPLAALIALGALCRRRGLLDEAFVAGASRLLFQLALPALLCRLVLSIEAGAAFDSVLLGYCLGFTLAFTALVHALAPRLIATAADRGVFVQGVFRSNMGVVALALIDSAYGEAGLRAAALPVAATTVLYNLLAVWLLSRGNGTGRWWAALHNPLIIGIAAGALLRQSGMVLPVPASQLLDWLAALALPLALLCVGAALPLGALRRPDRATALAVAGKLVVSPALAVGGALLLTDLRGLPLAVLYCLSAAPAASASFAMVVSMGGNRALASAVIAHSTLWSALSLSAGLFALGAGGLL